MTVTLQKLLVHERKLWDGGFSFIAGVDEAGRGCLAGPVAAAAVVFTDPARIPEGVNDSKQLTPAQRKSLRQKLLQEPSVLWHVAMIAPEVIDEINILQATWRAMREAVRHVMPKAQYILVDGNPVPEMPLPCTNLVKGDAASASIAAASILAKTARDALMDEMDRKYPGYGFAVHKGYGTKLHLDALKKLGVSPIHRKTFGPVRQVLEPPEFTQQELFR